MDPGLTLFFPPLSLPLLRLPSNRKQLHVFPLQSPPVDSLGFKGYLRRAAPHPALGIKKDAAPISPTVSPGNESASCRSRLFVVERTQNFHNQRLFPLVVLSVSFQSLTQGHPSIPDGIPIFSTIGKLVFVDFFFPSPFTGIAFQNLWFAPFFCQLPPSPH